MDSIGQEKTDVNHFFLQSFETNSMFPFLIFSSTVCIFILKLIDLFVVKHFHFSSLFSYKRQENVNCSFSVFCYITNAASVPSKISLLLLLFFNLTRDVSSTCDHTH